MKKTTSLVFVVMATAIVAAFPACNVVSISGGYSFDYSGETAERTIEDEISSSIKQIEIENQFGDVRVEASDDAGWTWHVKCWADAAVDAELFVEETEMAVETKGDVQTWKIKLPIDAQDLRGLKSNLTIRVPAKVKVVSVNSHGNTIVDNRDAKVKSTNSHGNTELSNLTEPCATENRHGKLVAKRILGGELVAAHGDIEIENVAGTVDVANSHGDITIDGLSDDAEIECNHGSVTVLDSTAFVGVHGSHCNVTVSESVGEVEIETNHGVIKLTVDSDKVKCDNRHGRINVELTNPDFKKIALETSHSNIKLVLPESASPRLSLDVDHGDVDNEFESDKSGPLVRVTNRHGDVDIRKSK